MAADTETVEPEGEHYPAAAAGHEDAGHPTEAAYWKIFFILFAVTGLEVLLYYASIPGVNLNNTALGVLAFGKFAIVVGYFMHLRFDSRVLRRLFVMGLILAVVVYLIYLFSMGVFLDAPGNRNHGFL
jgi:cytochrome c oxidase subunit IV